MKEPPPATICENWRTGAAFADALAGSDAAALQRILSPQASWHFPGRDHELAGEHRGIAAIAAFAGKVFELTAGSFHMDVHGVYASASGAVIAFTGHARREDGRALENPTRLVLRIADGQVVELWEFVWDLEAVAAFWR